MNNKENTMFTLPKCLIAVPILSIVIFFYGMFMSYFIDYLSFGTLGKIVTFILMLIPTLFIIVPYVLSIEQIFYAIFKVDETRRTKGNKITKYHKKIMNISTYCSIGLTIILFVIGYLLYRNIGFNFNFMTILDYFSTGPVILILVAIFVIPLLVRKHFDSVNEHKLTNIIHILIVVIGIIITIPVYNANPGVKLFQTEKVEIDRDNYGNSNSRAFIDAKYEVEKQLKAPSTAKFCKEYEAQIIRNGNTWSVEGWVDAQNSFGATLRNEFVVKITYTAKDTYYIEYCEMK